MEARHDRLEKRINQQGSVRFLNMHQKLLTSSPTLDLASLAIKKYGHVVK